ncbi:MULTISPECIES: type II toxin-antitoxin system HicB family antitoxin [unclassified Nodularia (in: cyanobacteria)]|uniref:type II toxin-antitoxin system HicB family antitoxin n=1 Tax=unclassified Nodularia (in: cyanobacteria) TaxID=2656917 RepID=UPI001881066A|nr:MULTISPECIES: type II toxin-antitoxin system HicB family antitoxin [unclassified Nodularia (in: cyanobacteria)]MBE9198724.1 type II toxin-antitoxin system HicB family antitoxin [Nodularia sp. LEGE 06071]MCC2694560.1 type II toxin-antitoxin system HicB family antitoxin [Nodularia sp. LEGE 04288]
MKYTIIIQWSNEDECFVVSLPEWGEFCHTHEDTYEEACKNAQEVLEMLIETALENGEPLPEPKTLEQSSQVA